MSEISPNPASQDAPAFHDLSAYIGQVRSVSETFSFASRNLTILADALEAGAGAPQMIRSIAELLAMATRSATSLMDQSLLRNETYGFNRAEMARAMGINRATVTRRIEVLMKKFRDGDERAVSGSAFYQPRATHSSTSSSDQSSSIER